MISQAEDCNSTDNLYHRAVALIGAGTESLPLLGAAMTETIACPKCNYEIEVTEVLAAQLRAQLQGEFDQTLKAKEQVYAQRENNIAKQQAALLQQQAAIDAEVATRLKRERDKLCQDLLAKAKEEVAVDLQTAQSELTEIRSKLRE